MTGEEMSSLVPALRAWLERFGRYFGRAKTFRCFEKYLVGLLSDVKRKSIEPIALAAGVSGCSAAVAEEQGSEGGIGVLDGSAHAKQGNKTPGVQRQWCGERGKVENCVLGYHLLYTDNHPRNPFSCVLASDLYLPRGWAEDRERCREAGMPDELGYRPGWRIGFDQLERVIGQGVRFAYVTFDEEVGSVAGFWFELDRLGQRAIGEVKPTWWGGKSTGCPFPRIGGIG